MHAAIVAAREAFDTGPWPERERADVLRRTGDLIDRDGKDFSRAEALDTGKRMIETEYDMDDVDGCHSGMSVTQEESFGPVLTVETFTDEDEAVRLANDTVCGLAGAVWTQDAGKAQRVANRRIPRNQAHLAEHQSTARTLVPGINSAPTAFRSTDSPRS
jgi:acyl-CoA reductase-like NAD-dependent aldehyde dehydrogenase